MSVKLRHLVIVEVAATAQQFLFNIPMFVGKATKHTERRPHVADVLCLEVYQPAMQASPYAQVAALLGNLLQGVKGMPVVVGLIAVFLYQCLAAYVFGVFVNRERYVVALEWCGITPVEHFAAVNIEIKLCIWN